MIQDSRPDTESGVSSLAKMEKRKKRKIIIVIVSIVVVLVLIAAGGLIWVTSGLSKYKKITINNVDLSKVPNGTYTGSFKGGRWSNTVEVTVKDHKITKIEIVKDVLFKSTRVPGELFPRILKAQSLKVDTVTGATVTSKAYLKAIEDALTSQQPDVGK